ncbi:hypothetical protein VNI00_017042 [Paramarasmius palmivorus]|uniref:Uncharacterized protein n=1 Tax=Paramarasmius palmivorus TaxID=297713 RepID=A0AAW0BAN4_9AGAR
MSASRSTVYARLTQKSNSSGTKDRSVVSGHEETNPTLLSDPSQAPLVLEMPWFTAFVCHPESRSSLVSEDLISMQSSLIASFRLSYKNPVFRDILDNRATLVPNQKSAEPCTSVLFGLRFLDIAALVEGRSNKDTTDFLDSVPKSDLIVHKTTFDGHKITLRGLPALAQGWARVVKGVYVAFGLSGPVTGTKERKSDTEHLTPAARMVLATSQHLKSLSSRDPKSLVVKVLQNMECTAFFINYLLQGHYDFPPGWRDLLLELETAALREGLQFEAPPDLPPLTRIRQPLFMAICLSPLVLLTDVSHLSANVTRLHMLRAWIHYGTERPVILARVEGMLWRRLFSMARGEFSSADALRQFLNESCPILPQALGEQTFFDPTLGSVAKVPLALAYHGNSTARAAPGPVRAKTNTSSRNLGSECDNGGLVNHSSISSFSDNQTESAQSEVVSASSASDSSELPVTALLEAPGKEIMRRMPVELCVSTPSKPRPKLEGQSWTKKKDGVDVGDSLPILQAYTSRQRTYGQAYFLARPDGRSKVYWVSLYSVEDHDSVISLIDRSNIYQVSCGNSALFVRLTAAVNATGAYISSALSGSSIHHVMSMTTAEYRRLDENRELPSILTSHFVLVAGYSPVSSTLDVRRLSLVGSCTILRNAVDLSIRDLVDSVRSEMVVASFGDFVAQLYASRDGKVLYFPDVPSVGEADGIGSIHSSAFSVGYSAALPTSAKNQYLYPDAKLYFRSVSTGDAFVACGVSPNGTNTEILVEAGSVLLFVGVHRSDFAFLASLDSFLDESGGARDGPPDLMGILLLAGDKL